jgi:hypothetical protein
MTKTRTKARSVSTCKTGKRGYKDEIAAKLTLAKVQYQDKPGHNERRVYKCNMCHRYHLTSQELKR